MRLAFVTVMFALLASATSAQAERRVFIIANHADGYGIDRCLADGSPCGAAAAAAYCKSRDFAHAVSYSRVDKDEITGSVPAASPMCRGHCDEFVAITCTR